LEPADVACGTSGVWFAVGGGSRLLTTSRFFEFELSRMLVVRTIESPEMPGRFNSRVVPDRAVMLIDVGGDVPTPPYFVINLECEPRWRAGNPRSQEESDLPSPSLCLRCHSRLSRVFDSHGLVLPHLQSAWPLCCPRETRSRCSSHFCVQHPKTSTACPACWRPWPATPTVLCLFLTSGFSFRVR
jgi:hypothetical protein